MNEAIEGLVALGEDRYVNLGSGIVESPAGVVRLEARLARLLNTLVSARGSVVGRDALIERVWMGRPVGDDAIDSAICRLRTAVGDRRKRLIQTVPKRGYRFVTESCGANASALCARGELALELWEPTSARLALSCFAAALNESPGDARALAGSALSRAMLRLFGIRSESSDLSIAAQEAQAAREAMPSLGMMWIAIAALRFLRDRDGAAAVDAIDKAVEVLPASPMALVWRSQIHIAAGRASAAVTDAESALRLDAGNVGVRANRIAVLFMARRFGECCQTVDKDLEEVADSFGLLAYKGWALMLMDECDPAVELMTAALSVRPGDGEFLDGLKAAYRSGGRVGYFATLARLTSSSAQDEAARPVDRAVLWAMADEPERALAALHLAEQTEDLRLRWISAMPQLDSLHPLKEFRGLCERNVPGFL